MVNKGIPRFKNNQKYNVSRANKNLNTHKRVNNTTYQRGGIRL